MRYLLLLLSAVTSTVHGASIGFVGIATSGNTFIYEGSLEFNQKIETGNFLVIYDIAGLQSGTGPAHWVFTTPLNAAGLANDTDVRDALFTYNGPTITGVQGETALGTFYVNGNFTSQTEGSYLTRTIRVGSGNNTNTLLDQSDSITIPAVPEPSTAGLLTTGALILALRLRKQRRSGASHTQSVMR